MRKAFFSFVAITLVALVLFVMASYLFTSKDFQYAVEKDLELRRVSERMDDLKIAFNKTIVDAALDTGYLMYSCSKVLPPTDNPIPDTFCTDFNTNLANYFANLSSRFSDTINSNATILVFNCASTTTSSDYEFPQLVTLPSKLSVNLTKRTDGYVRFNVTSDYARYSEFLNFTFDIDLTRTTVAAGTGVAVRLQRLGVNSTNYNYTIGVIC